MLIATCPLSPPPAGGRTSDCNLKIEKMSSALLNPLQVIIFCVFISTIVSSCNGQSLGECEADDKVTYRDECTGRDENLCRRGHYLSDSPTCPPSSSNDRCIKCDEVTYMPYHNSCDRCRPVTNCPPDKIEIRAPTSTTDRECGPKPITQAPVTSPQCPACDCPTQSSCLPCPTSSAQSMTSTGIVTSTPRDTTTASTNHTTNIKPEPSFVETLEKDRNVWRVIAYVAMAFCIVLLLLLIVLTYIVYKLRRRRTTRLKCKEDILVKYHKGNDGVNQSPNQHAKNGHQQNEVQQVQKGSKASLNGVISGSAANRRSDDSGISSPEKENFIPESGTEPFGCKLETKKQNEITNQENADALPSNQVPVGNSVIRGCSSEDTACPSVSIHIDNNPPTKLFELGHRHKTHHNTSGDTSSMKPLLPNGEDSMSMQVNNQNSESSPTSNHNKKHFTPWNKHDKFSGNTPSMIPLLSNDSESSETGAYSKSLQPSSYFEKGNWNAQKKNKDAQNEEPLDRPERSSPQELTGMQKSMPSNIKNNDDRENADSLRGYEDMSTAEYQTSMAASGYKDKLSANEHAEVPCGRTTTCNAFHLDFVKSEISHENKEDLFTKLGMSRNDIEDVYYDKRHENVREQIRYTLIRWLGTCDDPSINKLLRALDASNSKDVRRKFWEVFDVGLSI